MDNMLSQLSHFEETKKTLDEHMPNEIFLRKTIHLSQQFIYLQLFQALSSLTKTELAEKLPNPDLILALRNQFAHYFSALNRRADWSTFATVTLDTFSAFTKHYLYHHGILRAPEPIQLPDVYNTLFTEKKPVSWLVEFTTLQKLYALLQKLLSQDDTLPLDSPICNAMRAIIIQLNEYIKTSQADIHCKFEISMLAAYRNQDAHPLLQHDMKRQTLLNLAETIVGLSVKPSSYHQNPMVLFNPAAEFDGEPAPTLRRK